ncbi:hypothetical protein [Acinetobacter pittii]|uniref:hypothetical protein n=1 Tax=Acinetobacter pittii TaxID=48296 RepID=UPI00388D2435
MNINFNTEEFLATAKQATHSPALFHKKSMHSPIYAQIQFDIPLNYISSKTVKLQKIGFKELNCAMVKGIPELVDSKVKQVSIPLKEFGPVAITPMPAIGVYYELNNRNKDYGNALVGITVEDRERFFPEYNELIELSQGKISSFNTPEIALKPIEFSNSKLPDDEFCLTVFIEDANLSSNLIATGLPSVTSIASFFNFVELKTGHKVDFAIGISGTEKNQNVSLTEKVIKYPRTRTNVGIGQFDQSNGKLALHLLVSCESPSAALQVRNYLLKEHIRIATGLVYQKSICDFVPENTYWLYEADPKTVDEDLRKRYVSEFPVFQPDTLDYAMQLYGTNIVDSSHKYTVTSNGYALLNTPTFSNFSRSETKLHCYAEIIYAVCYLSEEYLPDNLFWKKKEVPGQLVYWSSL